MIRQSVIVSIPSTGRRSAASAIEASSKCGCATTRSAVRSHRDQVRSLQDHHDPIETSSAARRYDLRLRATNGCSELPIYKYERKLDQEAVVPNPSFLHALTLRCRALMEMATEVETIDQLRLWAVELADQAAKAGRRAVEKNDGKVPDGHARQSRG